MKEQKLDVLVLTETHLGTENEDNKWSTLCMNEGYEWVGKMRDLQIGK